MAGSQERRSGVGDPSPHPPPPGTTCKSQHSVTHVGIPHARAGIPHVYRVHPVLGTGATPHKGFSTFFLLRFLEITMYPNCTLLTNGQHCVTHTAALYRTFSSPLKSLLLSNQSPSSFSRTVLLTILPPQISFSCSGAAHQWHPTSRSLSCHFPPPDVTSLRSIQATRPCQGPSVV